jgi:site-specific DNA recombinase
MKSFFGYIRVSTQKQGQTGVSLQEQRAAIERYAQRGGLTIAAWLEERETAAKRGRAVFTRMLSDLRHGKAHGVIIHKIDRTARNLRDWTDLGELIDSGIEVHFATESLDLHSRGGRLSANIQAVVAADYIRNLREETRKGFYGRLKQGVYPLPAPIGYRDMGKGRPKEPDPATAPLIRRAFELYSTGSYSLRTLQEQITQLGLKSRSGKPLSRNTLNAMLNNPFYTGLIRIGTTGETFRGAHQPLISPTLFKRVQAILSGKAVKGPGMHNFVFRRMIRCAHCGYTLTGERQKGHVYYRCHTAKCPAACVREDIIDQAIGAHLTRIQLTSTELEELRQICADISREQREDRGQLATSMELQLAQTKSRLDRLVDAYVDQMLDRELFTERKSRLLAEQVELEEQIADLRSGTSDPAKRVADFLELASSACSLYNSGNVEEKRQLLDTLTSNRRVNGRNVELELKSPFLELSKRPKLSNCGPQRDRLRTHGSLMNEARWPGLPAFVATLFRMAETGELIARAANEDDPSARLGVV